MLDLLDLEAVTVCAGVHRSMRFRIFERLFCGTTGHGLDASRIHQLIEISIVEFDHHTQNHHPLYSDSGISIVGCHEVKALASRDG